VKVAQAQEFYQTFLNPLSSVNVTSNVTSNGVSNVTVTLQESLQETLLVTAKETDDGLKEKEKEKEYPDFFQSTSDNGDYVKTPETSFSLAGE